MSSPTCTTSGKLPINDRRLLADGWPYGRIVCNECGNVVDVKADGMFRSHKAIHSGSKNAYTRAKLSQLVAENPDLSVPSF